MKLINRIFGFYGCTAEDWAGNAYLVRSQQGHMEVIDNLPQIWMSVESIVRKPADPLDPDLIVALNKSRPVEQG